MKKILLAIILCMSILAFNSCSKSNSVNNVLIGNWSVVNDSSLNTNQFYTLYAGDTGITSINYNGTECGATFSFNSNGNLETSYWDCIYGFGATIDSANYVVKNDQITISIYDQNDCCSFTHFDPAIIRQYTITNLTEHTATLTYSQIISNPVSELEHNRTEIINLKK